MSGRSSDGGLPLLGTEQTVAELARAVRKLKNVRGHNGITVYNSAESIDIILSRAFLDQIGGGGGIGFKVCKVTAVQSDHFTCKDVDSATGNEVGDAFEVWPVVYEGGITANYDLTIESGDGMVHPKLRAGARLRVCSTEQGISFADGQPASVAFYSFDSFFVTCAAGG